MAFHLVERLLAESEREPSTFHLTAEADSLTAAINSLPGKHSRRRSATACG